MDNKINIPALRFKGFTNAWEQHKIKNIFNVTRGNVLAATLTSKNKSQENPYPVYSSQTLDNGLMGYYNKYLFENAITWTTDGANAGTVRYRAGKFYSTNVNGVLLSTEGYANQAVAEILNSVAWKYVSHVGNPKLMNNVMSDIDVILPNNMDEQKRISVLLSTTDQLITLHQRKYKRLIKIKIFFLEIV